jgi:hypothetical protein
MPSTQSIRRLPPTRNAKLPKEMQYWELETQGVNPLRTVDTSKGAYGEQPPAAGLNPSTGQTNQNSEITYIKTSKDENIFTLSGKNLPLGPYTLIVQGESLKIKSDGTNWWRSA